MTHGRRRARTAGRLGGVVGSVAIVLLLLSPASPAAPAGPAVALTPAQQDVASKVNSLISRMTIDEKFGQLEMAGDRLRQIRATT